MATPYQSSNGDREQVPVRLVFQVSLVSQIDSGAETAGHVWEPGQAQGRLEVNGRGLGCHILLRGMYGPADLWTVYQEMDVALMATTVCEPFGRVSQEAASVGVPTIAPAVRGITEQIRDGLDGQRYRFRDPCDLQRQMRRILTELGLLPALIGNLRTPQDTREASAEVETFYLEVLAKRRGGGGPA